MIIGITGSSGAGKSTVCEILEKQYRAKIITADKVAKRLSQRGTEYFKEIIEKFGTEILLENGELDRRKLANIIYNNDEKRIKLNKCTLKHICQEIEKEIQNSSKKLIAIDAPLLLEAKLDKICDTTIAVVAQNREKQIERIMLRDHINKEHAVARLNAQYHNEFYEKQCEFIIRNDEKIIDIEKQIKDIFEQINYSY